MRRPRHDVVYHVHPLAETVGAHQAMRVAVLMVDIADCGGLLWHYRLDAVEMLDRE